MNRLDVLAGSDRDLIGYGRTPPIAPWPNGARVAVSLVVNYEAGSEYAVGDGDLLREGVGEFGTAINPTPPEVRDLCTESTFEYGARVGVWRLARILDHYDLPVTFHLAARAVERNPEVGAYIRERGHEPCSHGYRWEEPWRLSPEEEREHVRLAVESITQTCGRRPVGWHSRCTPTPRTRPLVVEEGGFIYDSDAYNDDLPYFTQVNERRHLVIPYSFVFNDMRFVFPGFADPMSFFVYLKMGFDELWEEGGTSPKLMTIGLHPRWTGQPGRALALRNFIEYALGKGEVWFARREDIARVWIDKFGETVPAATAPS